MKIVCRAFSSEKETERETDRQTARERERESGSGSQGSVGVGLSDLLFGGTLPTPSPPGLLGSAG